MRTARWGLTAIVVGSLLTMSTTTAAMTAAAAAPAPVQPDLVSLLSGFSDFWTPTAGDPLHGTVVSPDVLAENDSQVVWINGHATAAQQFAALQDAQYGESPDGYDQSITISTGLGSVLGPLYVKGRQSGALPLTSALINSENGSAGDFVSTSTAKDTYSFPRPFLPSSADAPDDGPCDPATANASSLQANRIGKPYADAEGDLDITRVPDATDDSGDFTTATVALSGDYAGLCKSGSFPSGHTTTAYQAGITLATMLPELAPEIMARASENGNDRLVLGVHSPLDIMGGRISGHAALAALWSDAAFRADTFAPAISELRAYLEAACGGTIAECSAQGEPYANNPYDGQALPGGTSQIVTDRASGVAVYEERMTYGFAPVGSTDLAPSVPQGAENLLLTVFPSLTDDQRRSVIAQTQIPSGYALDATTSGDGSWQRVDLAAATSATVQLASDGSASVVSVGGPATVLPAPGPGPSPTPSPSPTPDPTLSPCAAPLSIAQGVTVSCATSSNGEAPATVIHSADVDLTANGVEPVVVASNDRIFQPVGPTPSPTGQPTVNETVTSMANRSAGVVVGVNGGYFDNDKGPGKGGVTAPYTGSPCGGVIINGFIFRSPSTDPRINASIYSRADGSMGIGQVSFTGSIAVDGQTDAEPLASINTLSDGIPQPSCPQGFREGQRSSGDGISMLTPDLGAVQLQESTKDGDNGTVVPASTEVVTVAARGIPGEVDAYEVTAVTTSQGLTALDAIPSGQVVFIGSSPEESTGGAWLKDREVGQVLRVSSHLMVGTGEDAAREGDSIRSLIGGVAQIVSGGVTVDPTIVEANGYPPSGKHAETVIGLSADGTRATLVAIDQVANGSPGVTWQGAAGVATALGVNDAILMDGGGSTTLVAQLAEPAVTPDGQTSRVTVINTPENDGNYPEGVFNQRLVGDGLFFTGVVANPTPAPTPSPSSSPSPTLPRTGSDGASPGIVLAGAGLVLAGLVLVMRPRRVRYRP